MRYRDGDVVLDGNNLYPFLRLVELPYPRVVVLRGKPVRLEKFIYTALRDIAAKSITIKEMANLETNGCVIHIKRCIRTIRRRLRFGSFRQAVSASDATPDNLGT